MLFAQPSLRFDDQRSAALRADAQPPLWHEALTARSIANRISMRLAASMAIGALLSRTRSKNLCLLCAQHVASTIGPGLQ